MTVLVIRIIVIGVSSNIFLTIGELRCEIGVRAIVYLRLEIGKTEIGELRCEIGVKAIVDLRLEIGKMELRLNSEAKEFIKNSR